MKFPWVAQAELRSQVSALQAEIRQSNYGDAFINALYAQVSGTGRTVRSSVASVGTAAGWWGRALQSADLPPGIPGDLLTPSMRGMVGRALLLEGETVLVIDPFGMTLRPAARWRIAGNSSPESWIYAVELEGPSGNEKYTVPGSLVLHLMFNKSPSRPWKGISPLTDGAESHQLAMTMETRLREEAQGPVGPLGTVPEGSDVSALIASINAMRGEFAAAPTTADDFGSGPDTAPRKDWEPRRIGMAPPQGMTMLRMNVAADVLALCGVPGAAATTDGQGIRELYRQFVNLSVSPVAKGIEEEVMLKFGLDEWAFDFTPMKELGLLEDARRVHVLSQSDVPAVAAGTQ